jgi:uncharacterized protein (DUF58 family)
VTQELVDLVREVRRIEVETNRLVTGVMAGGYRSVFRGLGIEFDEVREWAEGDDLRAVDWNVTARAGRPFVKHYVDERELAVLFLLDLSASMAGGFGPLSTRQVAARVAACLALSAIRNHDKVGLIAFSSAVDRFVPPARGVGHALRVVRDCLAAPAAAAATDLAPALEFALRVLHRRAILFILSDFLAGGFTEPLAAAARRHDVIAVRFDLPEQRGLPRGLYRWRDPESGACGVIDGASPRVRSAFDESMRRWRSASDAGFRRARVDVLDVRVPAPGERVAVVAPILRFFRMRELRSATR